MMSDQKFSGEQVLYPSTLRFDNFCANLPVGLYILHSKPDGTFNLDFVTHKMAEMVGFTVRNLMDDAQVWFCNIHPDDLNGFVFSNQEGILLRHPFNWQGRVVLDGAVKWLHIESMPELQPDGDVFWYGVVADITETKSTEAALHKKTAEMEQFTYSVSHDMRSPLVTVKTFLGYLEQDLASGKTERIAEDLQFIRGAADKMELMLGELLEYSRVGRVANLPTMVSFHQLADEALAAVAGRIAELKVAMRVDDIDLTLYGDRPRLAQIWQNLIDNAVKYLGDQPTPLVQVGAKVESNETVFFVRDNGIGVESENCEKIFGIFAKLDSQSSGAGLGLATVRRIVEMYGGRIWVESEGVGKGSCFLFTLPEAKVKD